LLGVDAWFAVPVAGFDSRVVMALSRLLGLRVLMSLLRMLDSGVRGTEAVLRGDPLASAEATSAEALRAAGERLMQSDLRCSTREA
jgi:hypothetical protein